MRGLKKTGNEYSNKLRGMSQKPGIAELSDVRADLAEFIKKLKKAESGIMKRAENLWQCKLISEKALNSVDAEVATLITAFEGCQNDLDDFNDSGGS